jgi:hypothetical protein
MAYEEKDMVYHDYNWKAVYSKDDPKITGEPDSTLLNRSEGYEMRYFINKCADLWNWEKNNINSRKKLEKLIRDHVPTNIRSQQGIKTWIEQNYKQYWDKL